MNWVRQSATDKTVTDKIEPMFTGHEFYLLSSDNEMGQDDSLVDDILYVL